MAEQLLRLEIRQPRRLPGDKGITCQHLELLAGRKRKVAQANAYLDHPVGQFWAAYWHTRISPAMLVEFTEGALSRFKREFPQEVATVDRKTRNVSMPKAVELWWRVVAAAHLDVAIHPRNEYREGVILYTAEKPDGSGRRLTLPLQRPLSWERFDRLSQQKPISFARMNTKFGDFCITKGEAERNLFGIAAELTEAEPFAALLEATAEGVTGEKAMEFFTAVTGLFATGKE